MREGLVLPFSSLGISRYEAVAIGPLTPGWDDVQREIDRQDRETQERALDYKRRRTRVVLSLKDLLLSTMNGNQSISSQRVHVVGWDEKNGRMVYLHWGRNRTRKHETIDYYKIGYTLTDDEKIKPRFHISTESWGWADYLRDPQIIVPNLASQLRNPGHVYEPYIPPKPASKAPEYPYVPSSGNDYEESYEYRTKHGDRRNLVPEVG